MSSTKQIHSTAAELPCPWRFPRLRIYVDTQGTPYHLHLHCKDFHYCVRAENGMRHRAELEFIRRQKDATADHIGLQSTTLDENELHDTMLDIILM